MMKIDKKSLVKPILVLTILCIVASALLGLTDAVTRDKIDQIERENKAKAMELVFVDADSFGDEQEQDKFTFSEAKQGDTLLGYVITTTVQGYGGDIDVMTGVNADGSIRRVTILKADDETPGLGQNTKKPAFLDQFEGKQGELTVVKGSAGGGSEILAVTSATISSTAVTKAVNASRAFFEDTLKGGI